MSLLRMTRNCRRAHRRAAGLIAGGLGLTVALALCLEPGFGHRMWLAAGPVLMLTGAGWMMLARRRDRQRYRAHRRGFCLECGYDLEVSLKIGRGRCPECGAALRACASTRANPPGRDISNRPHRPD